MNNVVVALISVTLEGYHVGIVCPLVWTTFLGHMQTPTAEVLTL